MKKNNLHVATRPYVTQMDKVTIVTNIVVRLLVAPAMLLTPFWGWLSSLLLDLWDYGAFMRAGFTYRQYQIFDKALDWWFDLFMFVTPFYLDWPLKWVFAIIFAWRTIGEVIYFLLNEKGIVYFFAPNVIEFFFLAYYVLLTFFPKHEGYVELIVFAICLIFKLYQEYLLYFKNTIDEDSKKFILTHPWVKRKVSEGEI